jgi:dUTP pyrophosphatase
MIKVKKLHPEAKVPTKEVGNAGYDLYASPDFKGGVLEPGEIVMVPTDIAVKLDNDEVLIVKERGSTGSKGLAVRCGVVDESYTGNIFVCINNTSNIKIVLTQVGRDYPELVNAIYYPLSKAIAQFIIVKYESPEFMVVDELPQTTRGEGKLGSTNK